MRVAAIVGLVVLGMVVLSLSGVHGTSAAPRTAPAAPAWTLPPNLFQLHPSTCDQTSSSARPSSSILNLPAAGTGASATFDPSQYVNNTAVNTTVVVPSGTGIPGSMSTNQFIVLGVGDPINSTTIAAAGTGMTFEVIETTAVPVAILPNLTEVYNTGGTTFSSGNVVTYEINHVHGDWWQFTYNSGSGATPITGSSAWENGTYNLGVSHASGQLCADGGTIGPSFIVAAFGLSGAATPAIPATPVPWAVGIEPTGTSSTSYVPASANAYPQFNTSLGTIGINGHDQQPSLGVDKLQVGSTGNGVTFPGPYAPLWGHFQVEILASSTLSPTTASLAYNKVQDFNATALNQTGVNMPAAKYAWALSPASLGTLNTTTGPAVQLTAGSATAAGKLWANVTYNCSTFHDVANVTVTPTGGPSINSYKVAPTPIIVKQSTNFSVVNGSWPYPITYTYTGLPSNCTSANVTTLACHPTSTGTYPVTVYLNDSKGHTSNATVTLTVNPPLSIKSFTASPSTLTVNTSMKFAVVSVGGIPRITYTFTGLPTGCSGGAQPANFTCVPTATGKYNVTVFTNDSTGTSVNRTLSVTVNQPLTISAFGASPNTIPFGGTVYLNVTVTPGSGTAPYSYTYSGLPTGCVSSSTANLVCVPALNGTFTPSVNVTDASGANASGTTLFTVLAPPVPVITSFTASPNPVNVSQATTLTVKAVGGSGTLSYQYTGLPSGCSSSNTATLPCTPTVSGNVTITVTVTDTASKSATQSLTLDVRAAAGAPTITSFGASPSPITYGQSTTFTTVVSGGAAPLTYAYVGLPPGCASTTASFTCTPGAAGNFTVTVFVNDSASHSAERNTLLQVKPNSGGTGSPSIWSFVAVPQSVQAGSTTDLKVNATGGTGTLTYTYTGLPAGCSTADLAVLPCTPSAAGNYTVRVYVNDSASHSSSTTTLVTVTQAPAPSPSGSSTSLYLVLVIVAVVAAAAVVAAVLLLKRRKKPVQAFPPMQPYGQPPQYQGPPQPPPG